MTLRRYSPIDRPALDNVRLFGLMSETLRVETNDPRLLAAAEASLGKFAIPAEAHRDPLVLHMFLDPRPGHRVATPRPDWLIHRYEKQLYLVGGAEDMAAADLAAGFAVASVTEAIAADSSFVRYSFIEGPALSMLTYGRGYFAIHAAGVGRDGIGVALVGPQGVGKSTLAVAAARRGLDVFAEDGVFIRATPAGPEFWGLPWTQRILVDAARFFPELSDIEPRRQPNDELKIEVNLDEHYPGRADPMTKPGAVVVLKRDETVASSVVRANADELEIEAVWPWAEHWTAEHATAEALLAGLPVYLLNINGAPDESVDLLESLIARLVDEALFPTR